MAQKTCTGSFCAKPAAQTRCGKKFNNHLQRLCFAQAICDNIAILLFTPVLNDQAAVARLKSLYNMYTFCGGYMCLGHVT